MGVDLRLGNSFKESQLSCVDFHLTNSDLGGRYTSRPFFRLSRAVCTPPMWGVRARGGSLTRTHASFVLADRCGDKFQQWPRTRCVSGSDTGACGMGNGAWGGSDTGACG